MPTGYTNVIKDGIKFKDFVLRCSRAFGAAIHMRDESLDVEIYHDKVSDFYLDNIELTKNNIINLKNLTPKEIEEKAKNNYEKALKSFGERVNKKIEQKNKYEKMLKKVKAWQPPTDEHKELKDFMINQIEDSIKWDCKFYSFEGKELNGDEWYKEEMKSLERDLEYYQKQYKEEVDRVDKRNKWIDELIASLK